jgi:IclR family acetate operon transcriptional repressor
VFHGAEHWQPWSSLNVVAVQSIERAFAILRALAVGPSGVTDLADRVTLPKSTVARLLNALETEGAIEQDEAGGEYRLGPAIEEIAGGSSQGRSLIAAAQPFLVDLSERTEEASGLDILDGRQVQFIDMVESGQDVQVRDWTGEDGPAHALSAGIAILAHMNESDIQAYIDGGLEQVTARTLTTAEELRDRLTQARSAGYVWVYEEFADGINSVAAPVLGPDGVVAALRVHGPTYRFPDPDHSHDIGLLVAEAAQQLSEQLQEFDQ